MEETLKLVNIEDARIAQLSPDLTYGVQSFGNQSTYQQYSATSSGNSQINFSCQIPNQNILIDRHVMLQGTIYFTVALGNSSGNADAGAFTVDQIGSPPPFQWGMTEALQSFPFQSLFNTMSVTINNCTISTNLKQVKDLILRMYDRRELSRINSMSPSYPDTGYGYYTYGVGTALNVLSSYNNVRDNDYTPRGSYPITYYGYNAVINGTSSSAAVSPPYSALPNVATVNDTYLLFFSVNITEPFIALSPFMNAFTTNGNCAGLLGVNTLTISLSIDTTCTRFLSTANTTVSDSGSLSSFITNVSLGNNTSGVPPAKANGFDGVKLLFNFITPSADQFAKISTLNCHPFLDYPFYTTNFNALPSFSPARSSGPSAIQSLTSANIQLSVLPDLLLIAVRPQMATQTWANAASFLTINSASFNFNSVSGSLASATQQDLFNISVSNGSNQTWYEFSGVGYSNSVYGGGAINNNGFTNFYGTIGSLLVINPSKDLSLSSPGLTAGSVGQFQLIVTLGVSNQLPYNVDAEIIIVPINSGVLMINQGTASTYTGLLTMESVLRTKSEPSITDNKSLDRMIGGALINRGMANIGNLLKLKRRGILDKIVNRSKNAMPMPQVGGGYSGGGHSGGSKIQRYLA